MGKRALRAPEGAEGPEGRGASKAYLTYLQSLAGSSTVGWVVGLCWLRQRYTAHDHLMAHSGPIPPKHDQCAYVAVEN